MVSQQRLRQLLQEQLGYSLTVRPSNIEHQDAGVCVWDGFCVSCSIHPSKGGTHRVSGSTASSTLTCAAYGANCTVYTRVMRRLRCVCVCVPGLGLFVEGEVPPGSLIALFPGLVYGKEVHR